MNSSFISESELAEARKRRQQEWEKVRRPEQPVEIQEEPYESRSLYERLKEQKLKKDLEYEQAHKLGNLMRGLNDDEIHFLEHVDQAKIDVERKQKLEEKVELKEFRNRVANLQEESISQKLQKEINGKGKLQISTTRPTQKSLLTAGIKLKNDGIKLDNSHTKPEPYSRKGALKFDTNKHESKLKTDSSNNGLKRRHIHEMLKTNENGLDKGLFKCVAILPGLGFYTDSSDSEISSDSEDEPLDDQEQTKFSLIGCKYPRKKESNE